MIIELRGVGFVNKGAELMLAAILERVRAVRPDVKFMMARGYGYSRQNYSTYGLYESTDFQRYKLRFRHIFAVWPNSFINRIGFCAPDQADVILDASGFGYGDKWGASSARNLLTRRISLIKTKKPKIILLPQAFGPFSDAELIREMEVIIQNADLIYARDPESLKHLKALAPKAANIRLKPDFTNLISGRVPPNFDRNLYDVAIIPNSKMIETASDEDGRSYIDLLTEAAGYIRKKGFKPFLLLHEMGVGDSRLAEQINARVTPAMPLIREPDPLGVKGIIGASHAVITSRFHGLVSSLSQAVPCLATSWSHKYQMLLADYSYSQGLLDVGCSKDLLKEKIEMILNDDSRKTIISGLRSESDKQKGLSQEMWDEVFQTITD